MKSAKSEHPFLNEINHRVEVIQLTKEFLKKNFSLNIEQCLIGHLFFGQRAFSLSGRDIGIIYGDQTRYYPDTSEESILPGPIVLIDETGSYFDIGVGEILKDNIGFYFENILINIRLNKFDTNDILCFYKNNFIVQIYKIDTYGTLKEVEIKNIFEIKKLCSGFILNTILFNLEKLSCSRAI